MRVRGSAPPAGVEHTASLSSGLLSADQDLYWTSATRAKTEGTNSACASRLRVGTD